ncbi:unnamed protein product [Miscanthus lutarioriparius]|uniref:Uncharacterized protein n=1 Tax=Miscanthus lutarioriparius TaxID=422564 RepID=A0A811P4B5_9POAL|nr:unnamed protein product [Miscanthus lutarioriparius]
MATAPARRPVDFPAARATDAVVLVYREAAVEPLPRPVRAAADCADAEADEQGTTALALPEEDGEVEATSGGASALEVRPSSEETTTVEGWGRGWGWPAVSGKAEDDERRLYDSDSDSDSDDEDEGGIFRWLSRPADHLF